MEDVKIVDFFCRMRLKGLHSRPTLTVFFFLWHVMNRNKTDAYAQRQNRGTILAEYVQTVLDWILSSQEAFTHLLCKILTLVVRNIKVVPVRDRAPRPGNVLGNTAIIQRFLNFGTKRKKVISVPLWLLYPENITPGSNSIRGWLSPRTGLDTITKRKKNSPYRESNPGRPYRSVITILTDSYHDSPCDMHKR
jgi:hypothetical protein